MTRNYIQEKKDLETAYKAQNKVVEEIRLQIQALRHEASVIETEITQSKPVQSKISLLNIAGGSDEPSDLQPEDIETYNQVIRLRTLLNTRDHLQLIRTLRTDVVNLIEHLKQESTAYQSLMGQIDTLRTDLDSETAKLNQLKDTWSEVKAIIDKDEKEVMLTGIAGRALTEITNGTDAYFGKLKNKIYDSFDNIPEEALIKATGESRTTIHVGDKFYDILQVNTKSDELWEGNTKLRELVIKFQEVARLKQALDDEPTTEKKIDSLRSLSEEKEFTAHMTKQRGSTPAIFQKVSDSTVLYNKIAGTVAMVDEKLAAQSIKPKRG